MALFDRITVPFTSEREPIIMVEDSAYEAATHNGYVDMETGWVVLRANPKRYLEWVKAACFVNYNPDGSDGKNGFLPNPLKLARSEQALMSGELAIPVLHEEDGGRYAFTDGRHRAYWLATHGAIFVPLLVPVHQQQHFRVLLDCL